MKIRADGKDFLIFGLFCLFLLYICAIGVLNASSLASTGEFYGFLPFEAFIPSSGYMTATFTLFFIALVGIFASCSSYFFDREKGFGFSTTKKDKGYSRWCKDKEMKKQLHEIDPTADSINHAGIALISDGKKLWVDDGEAHNLIVGATGSGKTVIVSKPMIKILAKAGESMVLTDPKGELYEETAEMLREKGYNVVVLNFRDPQKGNAWNPMSLPYRLYKNGNSDKAIELLDDLALNILYDEKSAGNDPFWSQSSADYFSGLALGLFEDAKEEEINLNSINLMASLGEDKFAGNSNYIKEYFNMKDPSKPAYINASGTVYAPEDTKGGVLSTFKQKIKLFSSRENLSEMLSHSDFDMYDIGREKTAVFMIIQDEKKTLHPLATIFIKQCYETLIDVAQENKGALAYRTNFILDEFANMPPLKDVTTMVTAARSRRIRFYFIIQNYAQLTQVYGKENAETIKGNCNIMYLISNELSALEEISKMCGEVKSKEKDKTASTPLVTVSDLQRLKQFEIIIMRMRMMPFKTKFTPNFKINWGKQYDKATFPVREKKEVEIFDIKEFVKSKKQATTDSMMGSSPFGGGMGGFSSMGGFGGLGAGSMNPFLSSSGMGNRSSSMPGSFAGLPFDDMLSSSSDVSDDSPNFNVDDIIKKINEKIAEVENEEDDNTENDEKVSKVSDVLFDDLDDKKKDSINDTSDDAFFDDFFTDD